MADLTTVDMTYGADTSAAVTADSVASTQTIPVEGKFFKSFLRVYNNAGSAGILTLLVKAPTAAGKTTPASSLGDLTVTLADGEVKYVNLADTARFMDMSTGLITITASVSGGTIGNCKLEFVQM
jgi:hypothetical protein